MSSSSPTPSTRSKHHYECAICHKRFPSPEAGSAHLDKKHEGHGFLTWFQPTRKAYV